MASDLIVSNVRLPGNGQTGGLDVTIETGRVSSVSNTCKTEHVDSQQPRQVLDGRGGLLAPSLCHPHVHLDKAFILSHPKFRHLAIKDGTFAEAMQLTSEAKKHFEMDDLLVRGQRVIDESSKAGVTHMRAFVEVDEIVGLTCLKAGAELKRRAESSGTCIIQLCAFAQLPLKPSMTEGNGIRSLMKQAMAPEYLVDVVGSTPYVEPDDENQKANIKWIIELALQHGKHLDLHLDYNLDPDTPIMFHQVVRDLREAEWATKTDKVVTLGHCTRLIYLSDEDWEGVKAEIGDLPISFVGLPTSDMYMMRSSGEVRGARLQHTEIRGTLPILRMIKAGLNASVGFNNIGNGFTPYGCCDPLYLAGLGVGIYQAGTIGDAEILYECVSSRAKAAIGLTSSEACELICKQGSPADFVLFGPSPAGFESEQSIEDKVYYYNAGGRTTIANGKVVSNAAT